MSMQFVYIFFDWSTASQHLETDTTVKVYGTQHSAAGKAHVELSENLRESFAASHTDAV